jgi:NADH-quinone oxidoreductase subunit M
MYQRTMTGPLRADNATITDLRAREVAALAPILGLIIAFGFYPQALLDVINPAVERTLEQVGVTDPSPDVPLEALSQDEEASQ